MGRQKTHDEFCEQIKDRSFEITDRYIKSKEKITLRCNDCGHEWMATPCHILRGRGCPPCGDKKIGLKLTQANEVLEDYGDELLIDISTEKHPNATMLVDLIDFISYGGGRICAWKSKTTKYISARCYRDGVAHYFHKLIMNSKEGFEVDHIKHGTIDYIDNRQSNLRLVTRSQNLMNKSIQRDSETGIKGVGWYKALGMWRSYITTNGVTKHLGFFDNIEIAIGVRQQAEKEYHGDYAVGATG